MTKTTTAEYTLAVTIVDALTCVTTDFCPWCVRQGSTVQVNAWVVLEGGSTEIVESCLGCLVQAIDYTPYADTTQTITVEVTRAATMRPF